MVLERMIGNLYQLDEKELISLNRIVVKQLKRVRQENTILAKDKFSAGDDVCFGNKAQRGKRSYKEGTIAEIKRTRAVVLVPESGRWTVPLNMLRVL